MWKKWANPTKARELCIALVKSGAVFMEASFREEDSVSHALFCCLTGKSRRGPEKNPMSIPLNFHAEAMFAVHR